MSKTIDLGRVVGNSAYEDAVANGYVGTLEQWLASLKGEQGEKGQDGQNGADGQDGQDGYSPTVSLSKSGKTTTLVITDKNGTHSSTIVDGNDGQNGQDGRDGTNGTNGTNGQDGVSPAVTITSIQGGHRVKITDAEHPQGQSFDVMDGEDGGISDAPSDSKAYVRKDEEWVEGVEKSEFEVTTGNLLIRNIEKDVSAYTPVTRNANIPEGATVKNTGDISLILGSDNTFSSRHDISVGVEWVATFPINYIQAGPTAGHGKLSVIGYVYKKIEQIESDSSALRQEIGKFKIVEENLGIEGVSNNILDPTLIERGSKYINRSTGAIGSVYGYGYTDYIPIDKEGLHINPGYSGGTVIGHAIYDKNKTFIKGSTSSTIVYEEGFAYVRFSIGNSENIMVNKGTSNLPYEPYLGIKEVLNKDLLPKEIVNEPAGINVSLPNVIYAVVGDTLQLFYRGIVSAVNPYNYNILVSCQIGKQFPRYYELLPTQQQIGNYSFSLYVKDDNGKILGMASTTIKVVAKAVSPQTEVNIACIGDSLTSTGEWCAEAHRRLTGSGGNPVGDALTNISFIGKKSTNGVGYCGIGGWSWDTYTEQGQYAIRFFFPSTTMTLSAGAVYSNNSINFTVSENNAVNGNILCLTEENNVPLEEGVLTKVSGNGPDTISFTSYDVESTNPLWDGTKVSFSHYSDTYCNGKRIDYLITLLSWNGQSPWKVGFTATIAKIKIIADALHRDFPNAKFKLLGLQVPDTRGGHGSAYGASGTGYSDEYGNIVTALNQNKAYQDFANDEDYASFVEFVNVSSQFDSEYLMPYTEVPVNTRMPNVTEKIGTNGVHPYGGYGAIGDIVYRNLVASLQE